MPSTIRFAPFVFALTALLPAVSHAQESQIEVRIDALSFSSSDGHSRLALQVPGDAAVALYLNNHVALESRLLGLVRSTSDGNGNNPSTMTTNLGAALFMPVHFGPARGRRGAFMAPGIIVNRTSFSSSPDSGSDPDARTTTNFGLDLGVKHTLKGRVSWRHALTYRTGDDLPDTFGFTSGISIFFR